MTRTGPRQISRATVRPTVVALAVLAVVIAVTIGPFVYQAASSAAPSFNHIIRELGVGTTKADGAVTEADGLLPDGVTPFDDKYAGIANLDPGLLHALREAATDAARDGVVFYVNSGWRSPNYQNQLLREAIVEYGSEAEAARWVATAETSPHVSGDAADIAPSNATAWLSEHGAEYGLCQIYRNEPWHVELRPEATANGCPRMYADPAHDPRMQQ